MKHILVPFDSFKVSLKALDYAAMLSSNSDTQITALHLANPENYKSKKDFEDDLKKITELEVRPRLIEAAKLNPNLKKIKLQVIGKQNEIEEHILDFAKENKVDFIIMASHGLAGSEKWEKHLVDTNSYKVVLGADCPVFTFTKQPISFKLKKIVLPLDLTDGSLVKIPTAISLAQQHNASIHLLSVADDVHSDDANELKRIQNDVFEEINNQEIIAEKTIIENNSLPETLMSYSESIAADLIIIMNRPKSLWNNLLISSGAKRIISFSKTPVLSMRGKDRNTQV